MKKIYVYYYAHMNLGDDLFLRLLLERYKNENIKFFTITSPASIKYIKREFPSLSNKTITAYIYYGLIKLGKKLHFNGLINLAQNFKRAIINTFADATVQIGGSIFAQERSKEYYINNLPEAISNKPNYIIGANIGPYKNAEFIDYINALFSKYTSICLRDKKSYSLIRNHYNVTVAADVIFNLSVNPSENKNEKIILICPVNPDTKAQNTDKILYYEAMAKSAEKFLNNGFKAYLISFCSYEGDLQACRSIYNIVKNKTDLNIINYNGNNFDYIKELFSHAGYIIAGRFHSMILALLNKKPVFPICYDDKSVNYLNDIGFSGKYCNISEIQQIEALYEYNYKNSIVTDISKDIKSAQLQFLYLDRFIDQSKCN